MKKLINKVIILATILVMSGLGNLQGQQLPFASQINHTGFIWNPAMTALGTDLQTSVFFRQQWISFDAAPRTAYVGVEYPWVKQNMSIGGAIITDKVGPISKNGIRLCYNYKVEELLNRDDQFSAGISVDLTQFIFDPTNESFNDLNDPLLLTGRNSVFFPSVGAGIFYMSNTEEYDENSFFVGLAGNQVYSTEILIDRGNFDRALHWYSTFGAKIYIDREFQIEPKIILNVVNSELIDLMLNVNFEMEETFWAGLGYSSASELAFQGGVILPDVMARYSELRIGALASIGLSDKIKYFGPSFEIFAIYLFEVD